MKQRQLEIVMLGETGVGKSCFAERYVHNRFIEDLDPTILESYKKAIIVDDQQYILDIMDRGIDEFPTRRYRIPRGDGFLMMFSVTDRTSFEVIPDTLGSVARVMVDDEKVNSKILLVGTKSDLNDEREVTKEEAKNLANDLQLSYIETSAIDGTNVEEAVRESVRLILSCGDYKTLAERREKTGKCQIC